eukprot:754412-Hanusia_phi.AAC.3
MEMRLKALREGSMHSLTLDEFMPDDVINLVEGSGDMLHGAESHRFAKAEQVVESRPGPATEQSEFKEVDEPKSEHLAGDRGSRSLNRPSQETTMPRHSDEKAGSYQQTPSGEHAAGEGHQTDMDLASHQDVSGSKLPEETTPISKLDKSTSRESEDDVHDSDGARDYSYLSPAQCNKHPKQNHHGKTKFLPKRVKNNK